MPASVSRACSPSSSRDTSPREKPSTRRLASSRPRSESATRAPLYTMPAAMMHANATIIVIEIEKLSDDFYRATLHYGFMESPRVPAALASMRKAGLKYDIMTTSFFLGRRTIKESPSSEMPVWQDKLYVALTKQAANATDFFAIPSDRVVELGAQVTI